MRRALRLLAGVALPAGALLITPVAGFAQEARTALELDVPLEGAHRKDSPSVVAPADRDSWTIRPSAFLRLHHLVRSGAVAATIDHSLDVRPVDGADPAVGTAGSGDDSLADLTVAHELYGAAITWRPATLATATVGRQFAHLPTPNEFARVDALHPGATQVDRAPGFDGARLTVRPRPDLAATGIVAVQAAVRDDSTASLRWAGRLAYEGRNLWLGGAAEYQEQTLLRPSLAARVTRGIVDAGVEAAVEVYDERNQRIDLQPIIGLAVRTTVPVGIRVTATGEYLYNGLARNYPDSLIGEIDVTADAAGGFQRPGLHYAVAEIALGPDERWSTGHRALANLSDSSWIVEHELVVRPAAGFSFELGVNWNAGRAGTEFGVLPEDFIIHAAVVIVPLGPIPGFDEFTKH